MLTRTSMAPERTARVPDLACPNSRMLGHRPVRARLSRCLEKTLCCGCLHDLSALHEATDALDWEKAISSPATARPGVGRGRFAGWVGSAGVFAGPFAVGGAAFRDRV